MLKEKDFRNIILNTPLVSIDLILRNSKDEILLGKRNNAPAKGFYFVPGGRIVKDERISAAFHRIADAELGIYLNINEATFKGVYEHLYDSNVFDEDFSTHYIVLAYELILNLQDCVVPNDEQHSELLWMSPDEILMHELVHENTKAYLR